MGMIIFIIHLFANVKRSKSHFIVLLLRTFISEKDGTCPVVESDVFGICSEDCSNDSGCSGIQKCCSNGCGHLCVDPEGRYKWHLPLQWANTNINKRTYPQTYKHTHTQTNTCAHAHTRTHTNTHTHTHTTHTHTRTFGYVKTRWYPCDCRRDIKCFMLDIFCLCLTCSFRQVSRNSGIECSCIQTAS